MTAGTPRQPHLEDRPQDRNWKIRVAEFTTYLVASSTVLPGFAAFGFYLLFGAPWHWLGAYLGIFISLWWLWATARNFLVHVEGLRAFMTTVDWWTYGQRYVIYGPGLHPALFREERLSRYNVSLDEFEVPFTFEVPLAAAVVVGISGSLRMRASIERLVAYIAGAAEIPAQVVGLVQAHLAEQLLPPVRTVTTAQDAVAMGPELLLETSSWIGARNLAVEDFEAHYGVDVGNINFVIRAPAAVAAAAEASSKAIAGLRGLASAFGLPQNASDDELFAAVLDQNRLATMERVLNAIQRADGSLPASQQQVVIPNLPETIRALVEVLRGGTGSAPPPPGGTTTP